MKTTVALVASLSAVAGFTSSSFNGAALSTSTRCAAQGTQMFFGGAKKKVEAAVEETQVKAGRPIRKAQKAADSAVSKASSAAKKAAPAQARPAFRKASGAADKAVSNVKQAAATPAKSVQRAVQSSPIAGNAGEVAIDFGSDVEAPFWDPAGLALDKPAETLAWYRAAELKHGRIAMLATLGTIATASGITLPDGVFSGQTKSFDALAQVADQRPGALIQIVLAIAAVETLSASLPEGEFPGDLGFDPANQIPVYERQGKFEELRLKELKNGRLAMLGIAGLWVQEALTGQSILEQFATGHISPVNDGQGYF